MKLITLLLLTISIFSSTYAKDVTVLKVNFPETVTINNKALHLNGVGIRKATFFKIKVYVGGFYQKKKSSDYNTFLKSDDLKFIRMHFVRDVDKDKMISGWKDSFNNAVKDQKAFKKDFATFLSYMADMNEKDEMLLTFSKDGLRLKIRNKEFPLIKGKTFADAILSVWFINASDEELRDGFLGKINPKDL